MQIGAAAYATSLLEYMAWGTVYGSAEANASKVFCWYGIEQ